MTQSLMALYRDGMPRPLEPLTGVGEESVVRITVETSAHFDREEQLAMLRAVPVAEDLAAEIEAGRS
jgi:hypothetical protein